MNLDEQQHQRRFDERDKEWLTRLDRLEQSFASLEAQFSLIKLSQTHTDESLKDKFRIIEKSQERHEEKLDEVKSMIQIMATEPDKSPAGRVLLSAIREIDERSVRDEARTDALEKYRDQAEGALYLFKWLTASGVVSAIIIGIIALMRTARLVP
jgi:hypothetical protein